MKTFLMILALAASANAFCATSNATQPSQLDDLIRGEMAAVKTYDKALKK